MKETVRCDRVGCGEEFVVPVGENPRVLRSHYWKAHNDGIPVRFVVVA